jgi:hypothetical protein
MSANRTSPNHFRLTKTVANSQFEWLSSSTQRWCLIGHSGLWRGGAAHKKGKKGGPTATTVEPPFSHS